MIEWATQPVQGGSTAFIDLSQYPAAKLMYAGGVAMLASGRLQDLEQMLRSVVVSYPSGRAAPLSSELLAAHALAGLPQVRTRDVASDHVYEELAPQFVEHLLMTPSALETSFELFEYLLFLITRDEADRREADGWFPYTSVGRIQPVGGFYLARARPAQALEQQGANDGHPWANAGLFDEDEARIATAAQQFDERFNLVHRGY